MVLDCRVVGARTDGLGRYTLNLAQALAAADRSFELVLVVGEDLASEHPLRELCKESGIEHINSSIHPMDPVGHLAMAATFRGLHSDIYHYPHFNLPLVAPNPIVVTVHDLQPFLSPTYFRRRGWLKRSYFIASTAYAALRAAAVIVPSEETADDLVRSIPRVASKICVIHEGVDDRFHHQSDGDHEKLLTQRFGLQRPFLLYVGVSRPHKNLERMVRAFASVADRFPQDLVLAGQPVGESEALRALVQRLGLGARVRWTDYVSDEELPGLYQMADAFILCSLSEGFGLPVLEAMASGTAVIVSNTGAPARIAGDAALHVDPFSVGSIAEGMLRICTDVALREHLKVQGQRRAAEFTWHRTAAETLAVYENVMARTTDRPDRAR